MVLLLLLLLKLSLRTPSLVDPGDGKGAEGGGERERKGRGWAKGWGGARDGKGGLLLLAALACWLCGVNERKDDVWGHAKGRTILWVNGQREGKEEGKKSIKCWGAASLLRSVERSDSSDMAVTRRPGKKKSKKVRALGFGFGIVVSIDHCGRCDPVDRYDWKQGWIGLAA